MELILYVKIGVVANHLNMKIIQMLLKNVNIILEDMNLDQNMDYGQNVGHVVANHGIVKVVEWINIKEFLKKIFIKYALM